MFVRSGYLIGDVSPEHKAGFDAKLTGDLLPRIKALPGVRSARILFSKTFEDGAPNIYAVFDITYENRAAMERALASPERTAIRASFAEILPHFTGVVTHINSDVST